MSTLKSPPRFFTAVARAASGTLVSRVFGLLRDVLFAAVVPKGITDTFWVAYRIPNLFRRLFGEGALTVSFIPVFQSVERTSGTADAKEYFQSFYGVLVVMLLITIGLGWVFASQLMALMTPGWTDVPQKLIYATIFLKGCFPYLFFIACVACFMGVQHVRHQFWIPSFAPTVMNWAFIAAVGVGLVWTRRVGDDGWIPVLIIGVVTGGVAQFLLNLTGVRALSMPIWPKFTLHPKVWLTFGLMLPSVLALSSLQINHIITTMFGSYLPEGAISALYYSSHLVEFPLGLVAVSIAMVLLPRIDGGRPETHRDQSQKMIFRTLYVLLPITVATFVASDLWVRLVFGYGRFDADMVRLTSQALQWGSLSILGGGLFRVLSSFEFSKQRPWIPAWLALGGSALHYLFCTLLVGPMGIGGISLSVSLVALLQMKVMIFLYQRPSDFLKSEALREYAGILISSAVLGGVVYGIHQALGGYSPWVEAPVVVIAGALGYAGCSEVFKLSSWAEWKRIVTRHSPGVER